MVNGLSSVSMIIRVIIEIYTDIVFRLIRISVYCIFFVDVSVYLRMIYRWDCCDAYAFLRHFLFKIEEKLDLLRICWWCVFRSLKSLSRMKAHVLFDLIFLYHADRFVHCTNTMTKQIHNVLLLYKCR